MTKERLAEIERLAVGSPTWCEEVAVPELAAAVRGQDVEVIRLRDLVERLREELAPLVDGMAHVDPACPEDDTCTCDNIARINALFKEPGTG